MKAATGCYKLLTKIERGDGEMRDLDLLTSVSNNIAGKTLCAFGDAEATPPLTTLKIFPRRVRGAHQGRALHRAVRLARGLSRGGGALMLDFINPTIVARLVLIFIIFNALVLSSAFMVWMERKVCAYIQDRPGPNRVGPAGLLQPFADVIKLIFKEDLQAEGRLHADLHDRADHLDRHGVRGLLGRAVRQRGDALRAAQGADPARRSPTSTSRCW